MFWLKVRIMDESGPYSQLPEGDLKWLQEVLHELPISLRKLDGEVIPTFSKAKEKTANIIIYRPGVGRVELIRYELSQENGQFGASTICRELPGSPFHTVAECAAALAEDIKGHLAGELYTLKAHLRDLVPG